MSTLLESKKTSEWTAVRKAISNPEAMLAADCPATKSAKELTVGAIYTNVTFSWESVTLIKGEKSVPTTSFVASCEQGRFYGSLADMKDGLPAGSSLPTACSKMTVMAGNAIVMENIASSILTPVKEAKKK